MTDEKPEPPRTVSVWVCRDTLNEDRQCLSLVEDTRDSRVAHRRWHAQYHSDREALRKAVKDRDETIAEYKRQVAEFARIVENFERTVAGLHGEVKRVETPVAPPALQISHETHEDEQVDEPDPWAALDAASADAIESVPDLADALAGVASVTPAEGDDEGDADELVPGRPAAGFYFDGRE